MGILVLYDDNVYDVVNDEHLDYLIAAHKIIGFRRSSEWVLVGYAPLRGAGGDYKGKNRRSGVGRRAIFPA
jgi:hypothetical protein